MYHPQQRGFLCLSYALPVCTSTYVRTCRYLPCSSVGTHDREHVSQGLPRIYLARSGLSFEVSSTKLAYFLFALRIFSHTTIDQRCPKCQVSITHSTVYLFLPVFSYLILPTTSRKCRTGSTYTYYTCYPARRHHRTNHHRRVRTYPVVRAVTVVVVVVVLHYSTYCESMYIPPGKRKAGTIHGCTEYVLRCPEISGITYSPVAYLYCNLLFVVVR